MQISAPKYHWEVIQGTDEWLNLRLGILTASEVHKLITPTGKVANNDDSRAIVFQKVAERITRTIEEQPFNFHMERGNTFEPFARDLYSEKRHQVREIGFITRSFDDVTIGYSPDGLLVDKNGGIEIKCPEKHKHVKEIIEDEMPKSAMMQLQTGMLVANLEFIDFCSFFNGMPMRIYTVEPDREIQEKIVEAAFNLEECIKKNIEIYNEKIKNFPISKYIRGY